MARCLLFVIFYLIGLRNYSQDLKKLQEKETTLLPSPAAATLGQYGGIDLKKYTGGIYKSIDLFGIHSGEISYTPSVFYSSNGFRVNDWGGNMGIGWTNNFTAVITRTVHGVADEFAAYSAKNYSLQSMSEMSQANLSRVQGLAASNTTRYDGEFDVYNYNLFGSSGSFIIYNDTARLLNHSVKVDIRIINENPFSCEIITPDGYRYKFGNAGSTEYTMPDYENTCDEEAGVAYYVPTAWYLDQLVSPKGDWLNFEYTQAPASHFLNSFMEKYVYKWHYPESGDDQFCSSVTYADVVGTTRYQCARFKYDKTIDLNKVYSKEFDIQFQYTNREDIWGQKLLSNFIVRNNLGKFIKKYIFSYDKIIAATDLEALLNTAIGYDAAVKSSISSRYFLQYISNVDSAGTEEKRYKFEYNDYTTLPHRFSFSQDNAGYYNGKGGQHFIPAKEAWDYITVNNAAQEFSNGDFGDRQPDPDYASKGLLKKIYYPTGGYDSVTYEGHNAVVWQNTPAEPSSVDVTYVNGPTQNYAELSFDEMFYSAKDQTVRMRLKSDYNAEDPPEDPDGGLYYCVFTLWDGANIKMQQLVHHLSIADVDVQFQAGHFYEMWVEIYGANVMAVGRFSYASQLDVSERIVRSIPGVRVKSVITADALKNKQTVEYNYCHFDVSTNNGTRKIVLSDSASANYAQTLNGFGDSFQQIVAPTCNPCPDNPDPYNCPPINVPTAVNMHYVSSQTQYDFNAFLGSHIAYSHITKKYIGEKSGFEAYNINLGSDETGGMIMGDYSPYIPMGNLGWSSGLERFVYQGEITGDDYVIRHSTRNYYGIAPDVTLYQNYGSFKKYPREDMFVYSDPYISYNFKPYSVFYYSLLSAWFKLDSTIEKYDDPLGAQLAIKTEFKYSDKSGLVKEIKKQNSDQKESVQKIMYVDDPDNPDAGTASNIYLKNNFILSWPLSESKTINGQTVGGRNIYQMVNGKAAIGESLRSVNNTGEHTVFKANAYNDACRLVDFTGEDQVRKAYVWSDNSLVPIAIVAGADYDEVAYTSFEPDGISDWEFDLDAEVFTTVASAPFPPTGTRYYNMTNPLYKSGLNASKTYIVSYWTKNNTAFNIDGTIGTSIKGKTINGWTYYEHKITGQTTVSIIGVGSIDELRLYPLGALMTSRTYEPLMGVTSECDANNHITYYEYDAFGRLKLIRDQDNNILKIFDYKYQEQQ